MAGCSPSGLPGGSGRDRSRGLSIGTTLLVTSAAASYSPVLMTSPPSVAPGTRPIPGLT